MRKTVQDDAYDGLLDWLKQVREDRKKESKGSCTMRALVPKVCDLLGRPRMKFSWVAKIEQKERRLDILEYVAYCIVLGVDPSDGVRIIMAEMMRNGNMTSEQETRPPSKVRQSPWPEKHAGKTCIRKVKNSIA